MKQFSSKPWGVIQSVSNRKLSGCLTASHKDSPELGWQIYFGDGRLNYATSTKGALQRIESLWQYLPEKFPFPSWIKAQDLANRDFRKSDYQLLCDWKEEHQIPITEFRRLLAYLTREAINQVLSYELMTLQFEPNITLKPLFLAADVKDMVKSSLADIRRWQTLRSFFPSPFAQICLDQDDAGKFLKIKEKTPANQAIGNDSLTMSSLTMSSWIHLLIKRLSLYELADQTGLEPVQLAEWLYPYISAGVVKAVIDSPIQKPEVLSNKPLIACVDDSKAVQRQVKTILEMAGYAVVNITDPATLLSTLIKQKPMLILMDINMPEIDGYELTSIVKRSQKLRDIPVVMLTGRDGLIDRMRAQFVGAVDFLTKPVEPDRLVTLVNQLTKTKSQAVA